MASFYRKWRPQTFGDVVGQEHIKKTLINALKSRKIAHAYLFAGPRGTGKTTMARLLAKSLNCEKVDYKKVDKNAYFEPCNSCASCAEISTGQSFDVIEIDAASHTGVDDIRDLIDKARFTPVKAAMKVYIIDEVHMLSKSAFNALLKTLEEPPGHVIFILATTESHKILPTIISRCQRYDFRRGQLKEIVIKLNQVAKDEKLKLDDDAIKLIGRMADGSFRDALSILDQIASVMAGNAKISVKDVQIALGMADQETILQFLQFLSAGDVASLVSLIRSVTDGGGDMVAFINQVIEKVRSIVLIKSDVPREVACGDWTDEEWVSWANIGMQFLSSELIVLLNELVLVISEIKRSPTVEMPVEILSISWMQRFGKIKDEGKPMVIKYEDPVIIQDIVKVTEEVNLVVSVDAVTPTEEVKVYEKISGNEQKIWDAVIEKVRPQNHALYSFLKDAHVKVLDAEKVVVGVRYRFHSERFYDRKNRQIIEESILAVTGKPLRLECLIDDKLPKAKSVEEKDMMASAVEVFGMES